METEEAIQYRRFTSTIRHNSEVWFVHIPKNLAGSWGLENGQPVELALLRVYPKPKEREKK